MKALLGFLVSRFFLGSLGLIALALLIWFAGPLLGFGETQPLASATHRWILIGVLAALWVLLHIVLLVRAQMRNRQMMDQLADASEQDPAREATEEELATLRERFERALATLRRSDGRKRFGGRWIYQLPWYLIIGPPGCGKTTALVNSGLRFPLADELGQDAIHGIGGTRNCDWWLTDEAVLIDTAGRYTTQDSYEQVDKAAWQSFLELLKKYRPRRPINGVLVAISLSDLLQQTQVERSAHAKAIRQRVQELCQTFGIAVPVYVLFMKADLIAGFNEFFADLGREAREQVWGMTFPLDQREGAPPALERFPVEFAALTERLEQRLLARMEQERDAHKRALVFSFPRQFAALGEPLKQFLNETFAPSRFEIHPQVRGVYFTSGTQTGTPIDRILASYAASFGIGARGGLPFQGTARSFFLTRLLREVIFREAGVAGLDLRLERRRLWLRRGAYAAVTLVFLGTAAAWAGSYARNRAYLAAVEQSVVEIEAKIDALPLEERDPLAVLPLLDAARAIPRGYAEREEPVPLGMGLGLYQGEKLGSQAQLAYRRILVKALLPRIILRMEEQIRQVRNDPEFLYNALRIYLMLDNPEHYQSGQVQQWVSRDWQQRLPRTVGAQQRESLRDHLAALFEQRPAPLPLELDGKLVAEARDILTRSPLSARLYEQLKRAGVDRDIPDFTVSDAGGDLAKLVLVRHSGRPLNQGIPALYTFDGYHRDFARALDRLIEVAAEEAWVLGPAARIEPGSEDEKRLREEVRERYLRDYVIEWKDLLDDVEPVPVQDLAHAAEVARILADPADSPLRRLLIAAAQQTTLDQAPGGEGGEAGSEGATTTAGAEASGEEGFGSRLDRFFGTATPEGGEASAGPAAAAPEAYVTRRFDWLHKLVRPNDQGQSELDQVLDRLSKLQLHLQTVASALGSGHGRLVVGDSPEITDLQTLAGQLPPPVNGWVGTLAQDSANLSAGGMRAQLNTIWTAEVLTHCREAINDRYPFVAGSSREATLFDFGRLLGPGGLIESFFKEYLAPIVDTSQTTWRWRDQNIGIPEDVLVQFQRAEEIRQSFFMSGRKTPDVEFELKPVVLDPRATQFILDLGGQILDYSHGPVRGQRLQWPPPENIERVRVIFRDQSGDGPSITEEGPWAWFRVLDRSALKATREPEKFLLTFALGGLSAQFELRALSVRNPFQLARVRAFQCPGRL